jgi:hypothetical protein
MTHINKPSDYNWENRPIGYGPLAGHQSWTLKRPSSEFKIDVLVWITLDSYNKLNISYRHVNGNYSATEIVVTDDAAEKLCKKFNDEHNFSISAHPYSLSSLLSQFEVLHTRITALEQGQLSWK